MRYLLLVLLIACSPEPIDRATHDTATSLCLHRLICYDEDWVWDYDQCVEDVIGCVYEVGECLNAPTDCEDTETCLERTCR